MKTSDLTGIIKRRKLEFISAENPSGDYWVVKMKPEPGMLWNPGEHGIFTIPGKKIKGRKWRAFSLASVPEENIVMIGTRTGEKVSGFKETLLGLAPGGAVNLRGPFGWYKLRDGVGRIVMLASGVGITPDRALSVAISKRADITAELVHSAGYHLFREDFEALAGENPGFTVHFPGNRDEAIAESRRLAIKYANGASYYISGSVKTMMEMRRLLKKTGVRGRNIIHDPFLGY